MGQTLQNTGVAVAVLGAIFFLLPHFGIHGHPGPPELWLYLLAGGGALFVIGWIMR